MMHCRRSYVQTSPASKVTRDYQSDLKGHRTSPNLCAQPISMMMASEPNRFFPSSCWAARSAEGPERNVVKLIPASYPSNGILGIPAQDVGFRFVRTSLSSKQPCDADMITQQVMTCFLN